MLTLKEQAEICRIGLITGLLSQCEIIGWADGIIEADNEPDSAVIDISLMGSADLPALVSALFDVKGEACSGKVLSAVLGVCADKLRHGRLAADEAAAVLDRLAPDTSCRRCNIRAEYAAPVDPETAAIIRAALAENAVAVFLAPYAACAADITFERA